MKLLIAAGTLTYLFLAPAYAHRDGCHRWHSCPSDRGTYECGDLGYTTYCGTDSSSPKTAASVTTRLPLVSGASGTQVRYTTTKVNLRSGPGTSSAKIALMNAGVPVTVQNCKAGWCKVTVYTGHKGYVAQQFLKR